MYIIQTFSEGRKTLSAAVTKMSNSTARGLRLINGIQKYVLSKPNQWDTANVLSKVKFDYVADGVIRGRIRIEPGMCNSGQTLHGGYVATLVDVMSVFSCLSHERGKLSWSTSLNVHFLNMAKEGEELKIESTPISIGKGSVVDVTLQNPNTDTVVARGTVVLVAGNDFWQKLGKEVLCFDFDEK